MRPIDADALKLYIDKEVEEDKVLDGWAFFFKIYLDDAPTIDMDRPKGEWIDEANEYDASFGIHDYICSNCNHYADDHIGGHMWYTMYKPNYCPYCGARMKGEDDE